MPHLLQGLFGERSLTKVAAIFVSEKAASDAAQAAVQASGIKPGQVRVLGPDAARLSRRELLSAAVEPEPRGIGRTLLRAHLVLGAIGAIGGWAVYRGFVAAGNAAILSSPNLSLGFLVFMGLMFGLLAGGLVALRPDHIRLYTAVRSELQRKRWVVLAHPVTPEQTTQVRESLEATRGEIINTL